MLPTGRFDLPWTTVVGYNPDGWQPLHCNGTGRLHLHGVGK